MIIVYRIDSIENGHCISVVSGPRAVAKCIVEYSHRLRDPEGALQVFKDQVTKLLPLVKSGLIFAEEREESLEEHHPPTELLGSRWEYRFLEHDASLCEADANEEGQDGWELVSVTYDALNGRSSFYFKREVIDG